MREFNDGLYQATTCLDYPQPFSYRQTPAQRAAQYARAVAALPAGGSPRSPCMSGSPSRKRSSRRASTGLPADPDPPITTAPPYAPPNLPVLVLSGDLDSLTTPAEGRQTATDMGPSARWILVRNDTHVNAMDDPVGCASGLVQTFIRDPATLKRMNASCATRTPEVRVVGTFPATLSRVTPATARPGDQTGRTSLRLAAVGAAAVGDAVWRWYYGDGVRGWGLRGGTFRFTGDGSRIGIRLTRVRWTSDTRVSGTVRWNQVSGRVRARLTIAGPGGISASVRLRYFDYVRHSKARCPVATGTSGSPPRCPPRDRCVYRTLSGSPTRTTPSPATSA